MRTIRLTVAYDGGDFAGFQSQSGRRTVQATLEAALSEVTGETTRIAGAGRTDAGVHASGQVVSFQTESGLSAVSLGRAFNACLPDDVAVVDAAEAPIGFHARYSARARGYRYTIWNGSERSVLDRRGVFHWRSRLDDTAMDRAAQALVGRRDFGAFCGSLRGRDRSASTVRTVYRLHCWRADQRVLVDVAADGFLPQMVRTVVGTLIRVGMRQLTTGDIQTILAGLDRRQAGTTAPSRGLCLTRVWYD